MPRTEKTLRTPLTTESVTQLDAGDHVLISGPMYTGRDAAHARLMGVLECGEEPPIPMDGHVIYYCGPAPTPPGRAIGSAGPTTSYRMDAFAPELYALGIKGTIGKGDRGLEVRQACKDHCAVYLVAVGGAGALLAQCVRSAEIVAYEDLGPEAVRLLEVAQFPAIVAYDCHGESVFAGDKPL